MEFKDISKLSDDELIQYYKDLDREVTHYNLYQMAMKILINSLYGALGTASFRYYNVHMAEAITMTGQVLIKYVAKKLDEHMGRKFNNTKEYSFYCDTDSIFLELKDWVNKITNNNPKKYPTEKIIDIMDAMCKKDLEPYIAERCDIIAEYSNARENTMVMEREILSLKGLWRAKKNYIMLTNDKEGIRYKDTVMKIMGVETARGATPAFVKEYLLKGYEILLLGDNDELIRLINEFKGKFFNLGYDDIAYSLSVNNIEKYTKKGKDGLHLCLPKTPWNVKAAVAFNNGLVRNNITSVKPIYSGDKVKLVYLVQPNLFDNDCIAYDDNMPDVFDIERYVDYHKMYEKLFRKPIMSFANIMGWSEEKILDVNSLF